MKSPFDRELPIEAQRLLNVARALRESPNPASFDMDHYGHDCGAPACALGHYAVRHDLQDFLRLSKGGEELWLRADRWSPVHWDSSPILEHFGINSSESQRLFSNSGCSRAKTVLEAAEYIEGFVARKWPLLALTP